MGGSGKKLKDLEKPDKAEAKPAEEKKEEKKKRVHEETARFSLVRISGTDLDGDKALNIAMLGIKGLNWSIINAICIVGNFDPRMKLKDMDDSMIARIEEIIKDPLKFGIPAYLSNRRRDIETGEDMHVTGSDLEVVNRFDVQRYIDLKTYRGWRHMLGQPVRGQRTRSKFRQKGRVVGVLKKSVRVQLGDKAGTTPAAPAAPAKK
ncbi:MAG: 30S ribosomal protein S13 [Candidatus Aenigmarchaeota archaeon]|nr:30S ribosomal protein S13 [Candidatus Aenigmarchaeota archaeon]